MEKQHLIQIDAALCVGCGLCRQDCPENNIVLAGGKAAVRGQGCIKCGHCAAICPQGAVSLTGFPEPLQALPLAPALNPAHVVAALQSRRSIRRFRSKPVPKELLAQILEAGRWTPTAKNAQNVSYLVLEKEKAACEAVAVRFFQKLLPLARLAMPAARHMAIDPDFFFKKAPVAILVLAGDKVDGALAASNMALTAEAGGLGVLYSGFFTMAANRSPALRRALGLRREKVAATLVLGWPGVRYCRTAPKEAAAVRTL